MGPATAPPRPTTRSPSDEPQPGPTHARGPEGEHPSGPRRHLYEVNRHHERQHHLRPDRPARRPDRASQRARFAARAPRPLRDAAHRGRRLRHGRRRCRARSRERDVARERPGPGDQQDREALQVLRRARLREHHHPRRHHTPGPLLGADRVRPGRRGHRALPVVTGASRQPDPPGGDVLRRRRGDPRRRAGRRPASRLARRGLHPAREDHPDRGRVGRTHEQLSLEFTNRDATAAVSRERGTTP